MNQDELPTHINVQDVVRTAVQETLTTLGMDVSDPLALQRDMHFLRELRTTQEKMRSRGLVVLVSLVISALAAGVWMGIKAFISSQ